MSPRVVAKNFLHTGMLWCFPPREEAALNPPLKKRAQVNIPPLLREKLNLGTNFFLKKYRAKSISLEFPLINSNTHPIITIVICLQYALPLLLYLLRNL